MGELRRITADEVSVAVHKVGATLARGVTWQRPMIEQRGDKPCGCPIGILAASGLYRAPYRMGIYEASVALGLEFPYVAGFALGFDGVTSIETQGDDDPMRIGFEDGRVVAAALLTVEPAGEGDRS